MTRETRLLREYGLIRFTILTRADGAHLGLLGHISIRVSSTQETSVREGITTTNDGRPVLLVMTNNSTRAQQLTLVKKQLDGQQRVRRSRLYHRYPLHSRTRPRSACQRSDATFSKLNSATSSRTACGP